MSTRSASRELFHYLAFGLEIESEMAFPELLPHGHGRDLKIRFGEVAPSLPRAESVGKDYQMEGRQILFTIPRVAAYHIIDGREIVVAPVAGVDITLVRLYLLGSVMGLLLHARGILPLHASVIARQGRAIAFLGASGYGKSTLAQAFRQRGYPILADDICALAVRENQPPLVLPGYANLKLPRDSARELACALPEKVFSVEEEGKYYLPLEDDFFSQPLPLDRIYLLEPSSVGHCEIRELKGSQKLMPLIYNTYRARAVPAMGLRDAHFNMCIAVSHQCRIYTLVRPNMPFLLHELVSALEAEFRDAPVAKRQ